jgi:exonuclease SbcD
MMNSIRLLHLADLHIGVENYGQIDPATGLNGRVMDFLRRLTEAVEFALNNEIDLVIFAGDAYKTREPNSTYRREFSRRIKRLADAGIPVVLLVGNHDLPSQERRASSIEIFRTLEVPNVLVGSHERLHHLTTRRGEGVQVATKRLSPSWTPACNNSLPKTSRRWRPRWTLRCQPSWPAISACRRPGSARSEW